MDRGVWQATVYRDAKSRTQLKQLSTRARTQKYKKACSVWDNCFLLIKMI